MNTTRIIKKYANRRLYDTALSSYITLDDIKQLVLQHVDFKIVDANSQADITKSTLLQIISDQEENVAPIFTLEILQNLIRSYGNNIQSLLGDYLERSMSLFVEQQEIFKKQQQEFSSLQNPMAWVNSLFEFQKKIWNSYPSNLREPSSVANTEKVENERSQKSKNKNKKK